MRDDKWLENKLEELWQKYFFDIDRKNKINIFFGRKANRRLASICQKNKYNKNSDTDIRVNAHYKNPLVPEFVINVTIAHELCHYAQGFASPLPKVSDFPHRGSLVDNELKRRGLGTLLQEQKTWLKVSWPEIIQEKAVVKRRRIRRQKRQPVTFAQFLRLVFSSNS